MTTGITAALAAHWLDGLGSTVWTPPGAVYVQLHSGDPGASGTASTIAGPPRVQITGWNPAAAGSKSTASVPTWANWSFTSPVSVTFVSLWDAASSGTFLLSAAVPGGGAQQVLTGNTVQLTLLTVALAPLAA